MEDKEMNKLLREFANSNYFLALKRFVDLKSVTDALDLLGMDLESKQARDKQARVNGARELMLEIEQKRKIKDDDDEKGL